jgi:hypothetical protein
MKDYYRNREYICFEEITNFHGKKDALSFFNSLCLETIKALKDYYIHQNKTEHGFEMREQQVKTYLTIALGKITGNNVIQEYTIDRNKSDKDKDYTDEGISIGRLDYWTGYNKTNFLIEVKHGWVRYYQENEFTFYSGLAKKITSATKQINNITPKKHLHDKKHMFGLSLLIAPIFGWNTEFKVIKMSQQNLDYYWKECKKRGANIIGFWRINNEYNNTNSFENDNGKSFTEDFYGVFFIGRLKKISKK